MRFLMPFGDFGRHVGLLVARCSLAGIFLFSGYKNIGRIDLIAADLAQKGYPYAKVMAIVAALAALGGGVSLVLGMFTSLGCAALVLFLVPTTVSFHLHEALRGDTGQLIQTLKNLGLLGGLLALLGTGPGALSVDRRVFGRRRRGEDA